MVLWRDRIDAFARLLQNQKLSRIVLEVVVEAQKVLYPRIVRILLVERVNLLVDLPLLLKEPIRERYRNAKALPECGALSCC